MDEKPVVGRRARVPGKEEIVEAVRKALAERGGKRMTLREFLAVSGLRVWDTTRFHTGWNELLKEAGCNEGARNEPTTPEQVLADYGRVTVELGRPPSSSEYGLRGRHSVEAFQRHFGSWSRVPDEFRCFAARRSAWKGALNLMPASRARRRMARPTKRRELGQRIGNRPVCGAKLGLGGMGNAPTNEAGVVFLFGVLAERLGFEVEAMQACFPDCEAKRRVGQEAMQNVKIEFEYESRNFRVHRHDPEKCDLIVCWIHNWPECPEGLEVIELKSAVERMRKFKI